MNDTSDQSQGRQVLLIDLDNCPNEMAGLGEKLEGFSRIVGCYAGTEPRIGLSLVPVFAKIFEAGKFELVAMEASKNAADFGLAFWAGRLLETMPEDTEFSILSRDKDLERVVELLQSYGRSARRLLSEAPSSKKPAQKPAKKIDASKRLVADQFRSLLRPKGGNPGKRASLRKHIQSFLKGKKLTANPDHVIEAMVADGFIRFNGGEAVSYDFNQPAVDDHTIPF